jgi:hypothetical protein
MQCRRLVRQTDARLVWFCGALLSIDLLFILVHSAHEIYIFFWNDNAAMLDRRWDIEGDRSYAEIFGYFKTLIILSLLISIQRERGGPIYLAMFVIFTYALVDDAFQVHELLGLGITDALALQPFAGLRARDLGELIVWMVVGVSLLAVALAAFVRSPQPDRTNGLLLMGAFALLGVFAVVADMVHVVVRATFQGADLLFTVIEDGGEQVTLTLTCGLAVLIRRELRSREPRVTV